MKFYKILMILLGVICGELHAQFPVNIKKKEKDTKTLLNRAARYFSKHSIGQSCNEFTRNSAWRRGDLFIFILAEDGTIYSFGDEKDRVWTSLSDFKDVMGNSLLKQLLRTDNDHGASLVINNSTMHVHVKKVTKDGKKYLVGCGFYPESPEYIVVDLVHRAVNLIKDLGLETAGNLISNPHGLLVKGDSYVFVIGEDGLIYAQGSDRARIGVNVFSVADVSHPLANKTIFRNFFQSNVREGWLPPLTFSGAVNKIYAAKYVDPKTKKTYLVGSVYYPEINDDSVFSLVQKAIGYIKAQGRNAAFAEFNKPHGKFSIGGMRVVVYTFDGLCLSNGEDPDFVGYNLLNRVNEYGQPTVQQLIEAVRREGRAWLNQWERNAYKFVYGEKIDLPEGQIIVSSGYWPHSKPLAVKSMVERAVDYLKRKGKVNAMERFTSTDSDFLRGDIYVLALDRDGIALAEGPFRKNSIWNHIKIRDSHGRRIVATILDTASQGGGWVSFRLNNGQFNLFVKQLELIIPGAETENLVITSGYYQ